MGKISSKGQVAIPASIRTQLGLETGSQVFFVVQDDILMLKKVDKRSFDEITRPFRQAAKRFGLKESDVTTWIEDFRKRSR